MSLELNKLTHDVDALGANMTVRLNELAERLPAAEAVLDSIGLADDNLQRKVQAALAFRWAGAVPTAEPVNAVYPLPPIPARFNVIAADGSQIYPDRHALALYYLINVGSIVFRHGVPRAPSVQSRPRVFYRDADLYTGDGRQKPSAIIDAERDCAELAELARLAGVEAGSAPSVALLDNGLLLYLALQEEDQQLVKQMLDTYLAQLTALRQTGAAIGGVVDRPRAVPVVRLLRLHMLEPDEISEAALRSLGPFEHVTDAMLYRRLKPGERSAIFEYASPANQMRYKPAQHSLYFFYLNAGGQRGDVLLRVEVPEWVAGEPAQLNLVHAAVVEQGRVSGGFPYVLMRAHELAVVTVRERTHFEQMVMGAMVRRGLQPAISQKAQGKAWTGAAKRRYR
jgi:hypothetical protein